MNIVIEELKPVHISSIISIARNLYEWITENAIKQIKEDAKRYPGYIARISYEVVGFIILDERECCVEIKWLAVKRDYPGRGIGTLLVKKAKDYACRKGKNILTIKNLWWK